MVGGVLIKDSTNQAWNTSRKSPEETRRGPGITYRMHRGGRQEDGVVRDDELGQRGPLSLPSKETKVNEAKKNDRDSRKESVVAIR